MSTIKRLLIANRGEIACRIIKTCQKLGIETVAVYSDADRDSLHTKLATHSIHIGEAPAKDSYLNQALIIEVAKELKADAIHPGYGFLSEQQSFAALCAKNKIEFIGPTAKSLSLLGDKAAAKKLAEKMDVPTILGKDLEKIPKNALLKEAKKLGFPVVLKAVHGGGGRGMRIVSSAAELTEAAKRAEEEAISFFGSGELLLEKFVSPAYHIEVQLIGDKFGSVRHLFERDCSLQRRSQKVIEEAPAPFVPKETLAKLYAAAEAIGNAAKIHSLVTVEFLVSKDSSDQFYFLEANPRIQVEHPVTETILGLDLVELQLRIANGEKLEVLLPKKLAPKGYAIEARLYAECPERGFQPSTGVIFGLSENFFCKTSGRIDHGLNLTDRITPYYDPMIAKLIAHGDTREKAQEMLVKMLEATSLYGIYTNSNFLQALVKTASKEFTHTKAIDELLAAKGQDCDQESYLLAASTASFLARALTSNAIATFDQLSISYPLKITTPSSLTTEATFTLKIRDGGVKSRDGHHFPRKLTTICNFSRKVVTVPTFYATLGAHTTNFKITPTNDHFLFSNDSTSFKVKLPPTIWGEQFSREVLVNDLRYTITPNFATNSIAKAPTEKSIRAPLPGKILNVLVKKGEKICADQPLVVLESMKIEHSLFSPAAGKIKTVNCKAGDAVNEAELLIELE